MVRLLEALTEPPAADTVAVRTAAAAVEELCVLEMYSWGNKGSGDSSANIIGGGEAVRGRTHASVVGDPALQALPRGGLWGPGTRNQRFAAMLTDAYARSAGRHLVAQNALARPMPFEKEANICRKTSRVATIA